MKKHNDGKNDGKRLHRVSAAKPDFKVIKQSQQVLKSALFEGSNDHALLQELGSFQDTDGSFKLIDSWEIPGDARVDCCYMPTYFGAALLMRDYLHEKTMPLQMLKNALAVSLGRGLAGHGHVSEKGLLEAGFGRFR